MARRATWQPHASRLRNVHRLSISSPDWRQAPLMTLVPRQSHIDGCRNQEDDRNQSNHECAVLHEHR